MKYTFLILLFSCFMQLGYSQLSDRYIEPKLYMGSPAVSGTNMEIPYEITVPGFVELHLIDATGKKVWIKGVVKPKGNHVFKVPTKPMKKNEKYEYILKFKGKDEKSWFYSPES